MAYKNKTIYRVMYINELTFKFRLFKTKKKALVFVNDMSWYGIFKKIIYRKRIDKIIHNIKYTQVVKLVYNNI